MKKNTVESNCTQWLLTLYAQIWLYQLLGIAIFVIARVVFLSTHCSDGALMANIDSLPLFAWNAWRFDIQSITYITLLPLLVAFVTTFLKSRKSFERCIKFTRYYYSVLWAIIALLAVAEFYFHDNFGSRYNVVFFDFFDEGPLGLLRTMWEDYPFVAILTFIIAVGIAVSFCGKYIAGKIVNAR